MNDYELRPVDLWQERLSPSELKLVRAWIHRLSPEEKTKRQTIIQRELQLNVKWGFFEHSLKGMAKRLFYKHLIHPFYKRACWK